MGLLISNHVLPIEFAAFVRRLEQALLAQPLGTVIFALKKLPQVLDLPQRYAGGTTASVGLSAFTPGAWVCALVRALPIDTELCTLCRKL